MTTWNEQFAKLSDAQSAAWEDMKNATTNQRREDAKCGVRSTMCAMPEFHRQYEASECPGHNDEMPVPCE